MLNARRAQAFVLLAASDLGAIALKVAKSKLQSSRNAKAEAAERQSNRLGCSPCIQRHLGIERGCKTDE
jgi:hypothetical protein